MDTTHEAVGGSSTRDARVLDAPELRFDLARELEALRAEPGYADFGRSSKTLARSGPLRLVLTAARRGVEVGGAPEADGPVAVQVLAGRVSAAGDMAGPLGAGELAWFGTDAPWAVRADEDAALLLAIAGDDDEDQGDDDDGEDLR
jgi:hypothetical protein